MLHAWLMCSAAAVLPSFGCSVLVDADRPQCSTDADCTARGAEFEGALCKESVCHVPTRWSCLENPPSQPPGSGSFTATFLVRDTVSQQPKVGLPARACRRLDVKCTDGISEAVLTDSTGHVSLVVPAGFNGYARFEDTNIAPALFFFDPPLTADRPSLTVSVNTPEAAGIVAALAGVESDSTLGVGLVTVFDCFGKPVADARIAADDAGDAAKLFYIRDGLPSPPATATDETGYGIFVNATPGTATFSASLDGMRIGSVTVLLQAGAQTFAHIVPNGD